MGILHATSSSFSLRRMFPIRLFLIYCIAFTFAVTASQVFYKLVGQNSDTMNTDERGSFLKKEFFSCASKDTCSHVVRLKGTAEYKEVYSHQLPSEEAVIYEKIKVSTGLDLQNCTTNATVYTNGSGGISGRSSFPLLNHKPSCLGSDVLTAIKLDVDGTNIRYNYSCCKFKDPVCNLAFKSTQWDEDAGGDPYFLDRHQIDCGRLGFLSSFQLERNISNSKIRYLYTCCDLFDARWQALMQCADKQTKYVPDNTHTIYTFAQIPVKCDPGFGLAHIHMKRNSTLTEWSFQFRCCKLYY